MILWERTHDITHLPKPTKPPTETGTGRERLTTVDFVKDPISKSSHMVVYCELALENRNFCRDTVQAITSS